MKAIPWTKLVLVMFGAALPCAALGQADVQTTPVAPSNNVVESISSDQTAPLQWSSGVSEILKLSRAGIGQETIVTYIASSGRTYNLSAAEIVHLKEQGVTDAVLTAMLQQSQKPVKSGVAPAPAAQVAPVTTTPNSPEAEASSPQYAPAAAAPATTAYVVPGTAAYAYPYSYSSYPYYYPYYGYSYPAVSFSFGFGGYYGYPYGHYGGWYGYHGGGYHGGGYHGGGGYHSGGGHGGHH